MTLAFDKATGKVVGQVLRPASTDHLIEHDLWMEDPRDKDYLAPEDRWCRVCAKLDSEHNGWCILTGKGYTTVDAASVRLEEVR